jgi:hypothetical protein
MENRRVAGLFQRSAEEYFLIHGNKSEDRKMYLRAKRDAKKKPIEKESLAADAREQERREIEP